MTQLSQRMVELGTAKSEIREAFAFAQARAAEVGPENVDDFSIGNPSVPAPDTVAQMVHQLVDTVDPILLHGYTPAQGDASVRRALADDLNRRYGTHYDPDCFYLTAGAAGALCCVLSALGCPGDVFLTFAPYFPEYKVFVESAGGTLTAVPANLASVLYNNTEGQVQVLAINTLGVLYIVEDGDTVQSVEDLKGKTIFASGKGSTPEYALNYMLTQNGIDPETDVTIEWKSEHSECVASLAATENAIAMLPQPFVTTAQTQNENLRVALDITEEWEKLASANGSDATLITGVVVGRKDFVEQNPQLVQEFLSQYEQSVAYTQEDTAGAAALVGQYDIVPEAVAQKALPECNITFIKGEEMQAKLSAYLQTLLDQNPKSIGGQLPGDDFYYLG